MGGLLVTRILQARPCGRNLILIGQADGDATWATSEIDVLDAVLRSSANKIGVYIGLTVLVTAPLAGEIRVLRNFTLIDGTGREPPAHCRDDYQGKKN